MSSQVTQSGCSAVTSSRLGNHDHLLHQLVVRQIGEAFSSERIVKRQESQAAPSVPGSQASNLGRTEIAVAVEDDDVGAGAVVDRRQGLDGFRFSRLLHSVLSPIASRGRLFGQLSRNSIPVDVLEDTFQRCPGTVTVHQSDEWVFSCRIPGT